jgi:hypothetical protein
MWRPSFTPTQNNSHLHLYTLKYNYMLYGSLTWFKSQVLIFFNYTLEILNFYIFSKFWCCSYEKLSAADCGRRVHHIKLLISKRLQNVCFFKFRFSPLPTHLLETRSLGLSITVQNSQLFQYSRGRCQDVYSLSVCRGILSDRPDQLCRNWFHTVSDLAYSTNPLRPVFLQQAYWRYIM